MRGGKSGSIQQRLAWAIIVACGASVLASFALVAVTEFVRVRAAIAQKADFIAETIDLSTRAALLFEDSESAAEALKVLSSHPSLVFARVSLRSGEQLASYARSDADPASLPGPRFGAGRYLDAERDVVVEGRSVGTVFVRVDLRDLSRLLYELAAIGVGVALVAVVVGGIVSRRLHRRISEPLAQLARASSSVARGDFAVTVPDDLDDELGDVARSFAQMAASLDELLLEVHENADSVRRVGLELREASDAAGEEAGRQRGYAIRSAESLQAVSDATRTVDSTLVLLRTDAAATAGASEKMRASITDVSSMMKGLAQSVDGVTEAIEENLAAVQEIGSNADTLSGAAESVRSAVGQIEDSVGHVARNAEETEDAARRTGAEARLGGQAVAATTAAIREISERFQALERMVAGFTDEVQAIGEITVLIDSVVDDTRLLSLNSAIIAAQAGESGRAFQVVAEEVKALAGRTRDSTERIRQRVGSVQSSAQSATSSMASARVAVEEGSERAEQASLILQQLDDTAQTSLERVAAIVLETQQQNDAIGQIGSALTEVIGTIDQIRKSLGDQGRTGRSVLSRMESIRDVGERTSGTMLEQEIQSQGVAETAAATSSRAQELAEAAATQQEHCERMTVDLKLVREGVDNGLARSRQLCDVVALLETRAEALSRSVRHARSDSA